MDRIGERLRRRREELGFTVEDIAAATKFRPEIIRAVEEGRTGVFPAEAYLKAFLRAYASKLKLDPEDVVRDQRSEEERAQDAIRGLRLGPRRDLNLRKAAVILGIAAVAVVVFILLSGRILRQPEIREPVTSPAPEVLSQIADSLIADSLESEAARRLGQGDEDASGESDAGGEHGGASDDGASRGEETGQGPTANGGADATLLTEAAGAVERNLRGVDEPTEVSESERGDAPEEGEPDTIRSPEIEKPQEEDQVSQAAEVISELELVVRRSVVVRLRSGDRVLVDGMLRSGYRAAFQSSEPFVVDHLTDRDAVVLLLNGERVELPAPAGPNDRVISEFVIPLGQ